MDEPAAGLHEAEIPAFAAVVRSVRDSVRRGRPADRPQRGADHGGLRPHPRARPRPDARRGHAGGDPAGTSTSRPPTSVRARRWRAMAEPPILELRAIEVRYGSVPAVRGLSLELAPRRDRRADRAERRRQVDDAARDHAGRAARGRRDPAPRPPASRRARGRRALRRRARSRGPPHLRRPDRRGEPAPRPRRAALARGDRRGSRLGARRSSRSSPSSAPARPGCSRAASSSSSRSRGR